jgi:hypothetical protein
MYKVACFSVLITCFSLQDWHYNMPEAEQIAQKEHRYILLNFSGSDWCGPCIRMHKEIFEKDLLIPRRHNSLVRSGALWTQTSNNEPFI